MVTFLVGPLGTGVYLERMDGHISQISVMFRIGEMVTFLVGPPGYSERMDANISKLCKVSPVFNAMLRVSYRTCYYYYYYNHHLNGWTEWADIFKEIHG